MLNHELGTDLAHTQIEFVARHMMLSKVRGEFQDFTVNLNLDEEHPEQTSVEARVKTGSINTREPQRDAHLRSPDFFKSDEFPEMVFKSTKVVRTGDTTAKLYGDLTIRDVTKPVMFDVTYLGTSKSPWGATNVGFEAGAKINREEWGLVWNVALETGGWLVGKEVTIAIEAEFTRQ